MSSTMRDQIQDSLQAALKTGVPAVENRVHVADALDRALDVRMNDYPCLVVSAGHCQPDYEAGDWAGPGRRVVSCEYVVTVDVVGDDTVAKLRLDLKPIASAVRRVFAKMETALPFAVDLRFGGETPVNFPSEQGRAGGFNMTFTTVVKVDESEPDVALTPASF